jgi:hypothetical protein
MQLQVEGRKWDAMEKEKQMKSEDRRNWKNQENKGIYDPYPWVIILFVHSEKASRLQCRPFSTLLKLSFRFHTTPENSRLKIVDLGRVSVHLLQL